MTADTGAVSRDGFVLEWVREGSGVPMLVLGAHRYYRRVFPDAMRSQFEMVFCDLRQWVATPRGFDIATITRDTFSDDVDAIRRSAGLERPIVVGHSQHGLIALEYARRHHDQVRGVVAVAVPASSEGLEPAHLFAKRDAQHERLAAHERNKATRRVPASIESSADFVDFYVSNDAMNWFDHSVDCSPLWEGVEVNYPVMCHAMGEATAFGGYECEQLEVPVFLALGRYDYGIPFYVWSERKAAFTNLRYELYQKSGHTPPVEQPELFAADVREWARSLGG